MTFTLRAKASGPKPWRNEISRLAGAARVLAIRPVNSRVRDGRPA